MTKINLKRGLKATNLDRQGQLQELLLQQLQQKQPQFLNRFLLLLLRPQLLHLGFLLGKGMVKHLGLLKMTKQSRPQFLSRFLLLRPRLLRVNNLLRPQLLHSLRSNQFPVSLSRSPERLSLSPHSTLFKGQSQLLLNLNLNLHSTHSKE